MDIIKNNPVKIGVSTISALAVIITTAFAIDGRYVHADDFNKEQLNQTTQLKQLRVEQRLMIDGLRKKQIEDNLFALEFKEQKTQLDKALIERYKRELDSIDKRLNASTRLQNSLPSGE